jgi:hypothetical protein
MGARRPRPVFPVVELRQLLVEALIRSSLLLKDVDYQSLLAVLERLLFREDFFALGSSGRDPCRTFSISEFQSTPLLNAVTLLSSDPVAYAPCPARKALGAQP